MPVRINLKELFSSDPQSITVDKLNFNFNKLLELGIGLPGPIGVTGPLGPSGPIGPQGPQGDRGNNWFVGSGNPNGQVFQNLQDEDFFIDTLNSSIWQYDEATDTWNLLIDLSNVVNNFLSSLGSTFVRGLGTGSPDDDRYIVFPNRGNNAADQSQDVLGSAATNNDIFFLSNFNEKTSVLNLQNFPTNTSDLYHAIQKIYTDYTNGQPGLRYHLELGSVYEDPNIGGDHYLTELQHNFKLKYYPDEQTSGLRFPNSNSGNLIYTTQMSMSVPDSPPYSLGDIDSNAKLDIVFPKLNLDGYSTQKSQVIISMGAREALGEYQSFIETDGIQITSNNFNVAIGTALDYSHPLSWVDGGNYFMLDHESGMDGIFLNEAVWQDGGNIKQIGSTEARVGQYSPYSTSGDPTWQDEGSFWNQGIVKIGNEIWTIEGRSAVGSVGGIPTGLNGAGLKGSLKHYEAQGSDSPRPINYASGTGQSAETINLECNQGHIVGAALCDIAASGRYMYLVNNQNPVDYVPVAVFGVTYSPTYFQIVEDGQAAGIEGAWGRHIVRRSRMNDPRLEGAWRVLSIGKYCIVATNRLRQFGEATVLAEQNFDQNGYITLINVEDPVAPYIVNGVFGPTQQGVHHLDMIRANNRYVAALSIHMGAQFGGGISNVQYAGYDVKLNVYSTDFEHNYTPTNTNLADPIIAHDFESNPIYTGSASIIKTNHQDHKVINKFGAIESDGRYIYAIYKNGYYLYDLQVLSDCSNNIVDLFTAETIDYVYSQSIIGSNITASAMVTDVKVVGNSLYILYSESSGSGNYDPDHTYILKLDISDPQNPVTVYDKLLDNPATGDEYRTASRLISVGNNLYTSIIDDDRDSNLPGLVPIEIDGIEADAVHFGSVRADELSITGESSVGGPLDIRSHLSVGGYSFFQGGVSIRRQSKFNAYWHEWSEGLVIKEGTGVEPSILTADPNTLQITTGGDLRLVQGGYNPPIAWSPGSGGIEIYAEDVMHIESRDEIKISALDNITIDSDADILAIAPGDITLVTDSITGTGNITIAQGFSNPGSIYILNAGFGDVDISTLAGDISIVTNNASAQVTISGGDALAVGVPGQEGVIVNGKNHIPKLGQITTAQPNESILLSGTLEPVSKAYSFTWQRVGNVVHVNGKVDCGAAGGTGGTGIPMPLAGPGLASSVLFFEGNGTLGTPTLQAVEVQQVAGTTNIRIIGNGGITPTSNTARINYSYVLI